MPHINKDKFNQLNSRFMSILQQTNEAILLKIKVIPKASRSEIVGIENDQLKIRLAAIPDKGEANRELVEFIADFLSLGKSHILLVKGTTSRNKTLSITGLKMVDIKEKLKSWVLLED